MVTRMVRMGCDKMENKKLGTAENPRHILGLSGGKDSTALAVYLKKNKPEIFDKVELFFTDTGAELQEIYEYLDMLEEYLGKPILRIKARLNEKNTVDFKVTDKEDETLPFDDIVYNKYNGFLPSARARFCTRDLKITPLKKWIGKEYAISYVGIRADEPNRTGLVNKKNIISVFPFVEDGLVLDDIYKLLEETVGMPPYYKWRTRSGCYFCFYQRKVEFAIMYHLYPHWFEEAKKYEQEHEDGRRYTWLYKTPLEEIEKDSLKIIDRYVDTQYYKATKVERSFMKLKLHEMRKMIKEGKIREFVDTWDLKRLHDVTGENIDGCNICRI